MLEKDQHLLFLERGNSVSLDFRVFDGYHGTCLGYLS